jgi:hypothetical protein
MITLQKATRIRFEGKIPYCMPSDMLFLLYEKCEEFFYQNKTDLELIFIDDYTSERRFIDQASAEEWGNIVQIEADKNNVKIAEIKIVDI